MKTIDIKKYFLSRNLIIKEYNENLSNKYSVSDSEIIELCGDNLAGVLNNSMLIDDDIVTYLVFEIPNEKIKRKSKSPKKSNSVNRLVSSPQKYKLVGLFNGEYDMKNNIFINMYSCSIRSKVGELLGYYALLKAYSLFKLEQMMGNISGGIPAIQNTNSPHVAQQKKQKLVDYHTKRGAMVIGDKFMYNVHNIKLKEI